MPFTAHVRIRNSLPAFFCASIACAADTDMKSEMHSLAAPTTQPAAQVAEPEQTPLGPLMDALDKSGLADPLNRAGINIYGFVESSYTYNLCAPSGGINEGRSFDQYKNRFVFDQADLTIERTVDATKKQWDAGFRVETIWGWDASLVHSNGLFDWYDGPQDPHAQWDLNQAYADVAAPLGNGLRIRAGKYVTLLGAETINPNTVLLFSRAYLFNYAIPFTHTGVLATYYLDDNWTVSGSIWRGWEQSTEDNNDAPSYEAQTTYTSSDKKWSVINNLVSGPEQPHDTDHFRTVWDVVVCYLPDPNGPWTFMINTDYGYEPAVPGIGQSQWYGVAGYSGYRIDSRFTLNSRLEWFRDNDGSRIGVAGNFYEATLGVSIHPFSGSLGSNLVLRPELRFDYSDQSFFDGGNDHAQATAAMDVIFNF